MPELVNIASLPEEIEIFGEEKQAAPLVWDMELPPHVDLERIVINAGYLRSLHKVGSIAGGLVESYDGDLSETSTIVTGVHLDGSAVGGKSYLVKRSEESQGDYIDPIEGATDTSIGETIVRHRLNKPELSSIVADRTAAGETSEDAWATLLDSALRNSMRESAKKHLIKRPQEEWPIISYGWPALAAYFDVAAPGSLGSIWFTGVYLVFDQGVALAKSAAMSRELGVKILPRFSIFPNRQLDRYIVLNAMSRRPGLVKSLE